MYRLELSDLNLENGIFYKWKYFKYNKEIKQEQYYNYVRKRLKKSVYPNQANNFFFLKMPEILKKHKNYTDKEIPIYWLLSNIIMYFWNKGFMTFNSEQNNSFTIRFYKTKKLINFLNKLNIEYGLEDSRFISIIKKDEIFEINKKLNLKLPDINKSYFGRVETNLVDYPTFLIVDIPNIKIPLPILFNILLVFYDKRNAFYLMEWDFDIDIIKKYFPNIFIYTEFENYYIISKNKLHPIGKDKIIWLGEVLEYSCPGQIINRPIYSAISYYINDELFMSEICHNYKNIKDKTKEFKSIAVFYNLKLTSEKVKNKRVKIGIINHLIKNIKDKDLKNNIKSLLLGEINSFIYKGDENIEYLNNYIIKNDNKIKINYKK